jgi:nitroreductase
LSQPTLFRRRFSCRAFTAEPLTPAEVEALVEAAVWAPSAGNLQPWRVLVISDRILRQALARAALEQGFVAQAPVVFVMCAVPEESARRYGDRGRNLYCLQDTAAAVENLLLAATDLGLGSCWVGAFDEVAASRALQLPAGWRAVALVPVGHKAEEPGRRRRRPTQEVVLYRG